MPLRRVSWACLIGAYVTASTGLISKPGLADNGFSPVQQRIEQLREEHDIPGASVAVIEDGTIAWAQGFGVADLASGRPVTEDTLFQAQSITKTLTALATVKLLAAKQIALDEPVNRYLQSWTIPENDYTAKVPVSFRMLLNHTGALSNPYPDGCCGPKETLPTLQQVLRGMPPANNQPLTVVRIPGSSFDYCNGCYTVLQPALESISQQSFPGLMQELVLTPAGMNRSTFNNSFFLHNKSTIAIPYDVDDQPHARAPMRHPILSTGLMWSTAIDLARFNIAFTKALNASHRLIKKDLAKQLSIPSSSASRSLGFFIGNRDADTATQGRYLFHSGSGNGYLSLSIISLDGKHGAVLLINKAPNPWLTTNIPQYDFIKRSLKAINTTNEWPE
jgi:CubicO group peptidase (beta-lactamase class C family)